MFMMLCMFIHYLNPAFLSNKHDSIQVTANVIMHKNVSLKVGGFGDYLG